MSWCGEMSCVDAGEVIDGKLNGEQKNISFSACGKVKKKIVRKHTKFTN